MTPGTTARNRLADILDVDVEELAVLDDLPDEDVRWLRLRVGEAITRDDRDRLGGVAAAGKLLPLKLVAGAAQRWFGARLCAQLVAATEPDRAAAIAERMELDFLVDVTRRLDPRDASEVVARMPDDLVLQVARRLVADGDLDVLAEMVDELPTREVAMVTGNLLPDDVVDVAVRVSRPDRLRAVVATIPDEHRERIRVVVDDRAPHLAGVFDPA